MLVGVTVVTMHLEYGLVTLLFLGNLRAYGTSLVAFLALHAIISGTSIPNLFLRCQSMLVR